MEIGKYYKIIPNYQLDSRYRVGKLLREDNIFYFLVMNSGITVPYLKDTCKLTPLTELEEALL